MFGRIGARHVYDGKIDSPAWQDFTQQRLVSVEHFIGKDDVASALKRLQNSNRSGRSGRIDDCAGAGFQYRKSVFQSMLYRIVDQRILKARDELAVWTMLMVVVR